MSSSATEQPRSDISALQSLALFLRLAALVARAQLRSWQRGSGLGQSPTTYRNLILGWLALGPVFAVGARLLIDLEIDRVIVPVLVVTSYAVVFGVAAVARSRSAQLLMSGLPVLPMQQKILSFVPSALLMVAGCWVTIPALALLLLDAPLAGPARVLMALGFLVVHGLVYGSLAGLISLQLPELLRTLCSTALVLAWIGAGLFVVEPEAVGDGLAGPWEYVFGWPAASEWMIDRNVPVSLISMAVSLLIVVVAQIGILRFGMSAESEARGSRPLVGWRPRTAVWTTLFWLQVVKVTRNTGQLGSLIGITGLLLFTFAFSEWQNLGAEPRLQFFLPLAVASAHLSLTARGQYRRSWPLPIVLGLSVGSFVAGVVTATMALAGLPWVLFVLASGISTSSVDVVGIGLSLGFCSQAAASLFGFLLTPSERNLGGEMLGFILTAITVMGVLQVTTRVGGEEGLPLVAAILLAGTLMLITTALIERGRWRARVRHLAGASPSHEATGAGM